MTAIVGLVHEGSVWIGGDSAGTYAQSYGQQIRADVKVFTRERYAFGFTTSFRMGQLLRYSMRVPEKPPSRDLEEFMATDFIDAVRDCLKQGGFARKDNEVERGGGFLVGYLGRLFMIGGDYQVGENVVPYNAVGSGEDIALGALHATQGLRLNPRARIRSALEAAATWNAAVRPPFKIVKTRP